MRFLIDAQLSPALVGWLRSKGHEAEHVSVALSETAPDQTIVAHAAGCGAIIVSKDGDFVELLEARSHAPTLLYICMGNAVNRMLNLHGKCGQPHADCSIGVRMGTN
jgi:predicted nuclease of predicted toxin-antitoxin system